MSTLDPLADFFAVWGEGGEFYNGQSSAVSTSFNGQTGSYVSDLADIVRNDSAFATCQVNHAWDFLRDEVSTVTNSLRTALHHILFRPTIALRSYSTLSLRIQLLSKVGVVMAL